MLFGSLYESSDALGANTPLPAREPDEHRFAFKVLHGHEAPAPAVITVVSVVTRCKEVPGRNDHLFGGSVALLNLPRIIVDSPIENDVVLHLSKALEVESFVLVIGDVIHDLGVLED